MATFFCQAQPKTQQNWAELGTAQPHFVIKKICVKFFWGSMKFWVQKMLRSKKYLTEKFPDSKNLLGQDDFCVRFILVSENVLGET